jgi:hypothetical protein
MRALVDMRIAFLGAAVALVAGCFDFSQLTAPESSKCGSAPMFCDGFESPSAYVSNWKEFPNDNGAVAIDGGRAYRGAHSFYMQTPAVGPSIVTSAGVGHPQVPAPHHVRGFFFIPPISTSWGHAIFQMQQSLPPADDISVGINAGNKFYFSDRINGTPVTTPTTVDVPTNQWVCVEFTIGIGSGGGPSMQLAINDHGDPKLYHERPAAPGPLDEFVISLSARNDSGPVAAFEMWADEIAISDSSIGCAK